MAINRNTEQLWVPTASGLLIPAGVVSNRLSSSTQTFLDFKDKAKAIEQLFLDNDVPLSPGCDLADLIADATRLSDAWLMDDLATVNNLLLLRVASIDRIADAVLPLATEPNRIKYLTALTSGSLDLLKRGRSVAKDTLWELELWSMLNRRGITATLHEPDLVAHFEDATVGIACKKLYSENNVSKVLSEGVSQIEATHKFGVLAVNLDDLLAGGQIMQATTKADMGRKIEKMNNAFLRKHKRHFMRYLRPGRVISSMVSRTLLADLSAYKPRCNVGSEATLWAVPGLPPEKLKQLQRFRFQLLEQ